MKRITIIGLANYILVLVYLVFSMVANNNLKFGVFLKNLLILMIALNISIMLLLKMMEELSSVGSHIGDAQCDLGNSIDVKLENDESEIKDILSDSLKSQEGLENSFDEIDIKDINKIN